MTTPKVVIFIKLLPGDGGFPLTLCRDGGPVVEESGVGRVEVD